MTGAKTEAGNTQDETGTTCNCRKYGNVKKITITTMTKINWRYVKRTREPTERFPDGQSTNNLSNKISLKVLEISLWNK